MAKVFRGFLIVLIGLILVVTCKTGGLAMEGVNAQKGQVDNSQHPEISLSLNRQAISYSPGELLKYSIVIKNNGIGKLESLNINDSLLNKLTDIASLAPGEELVFHETYPIPTDFDGELIANIVTVTGNAYGMEPLDIQGFEAYMERFSSIEYIPE
ncbi:MAG: hypothetical protein GX352_10320 [Clostridiales bacterium]|nr:hypothetical protein [Clostridiales bacterium]